MALTDSYYYYYCLRVISSFFCFIVITITRVIITVERTLPRRLRGFLAWVEAAAPGNSC